MVVVTSAEVDASRPVRRIRRAIRCLLAVALLITVSVVFGLLSPASAADISSLPTDDVAQITSDRQVRVSSILQVGDTIYVGGSFTEVDEEPRTRLAAIDAPNGEPNDGELIATWTPRTNAPVLALAASPDGRHIYVGGSFDEVRGKGEDWVSREGLVAFWANGEADAGKVVPGWDAHADNAVFSLATSADRVYVGGRFSSINGEPREHLAAVSVTTGIEVPNWTPSTDGNVRTLALSPDGSRLYVGGNFNRLSGQQRFNLGALDPGTGAVKDWIPNPFMDNLQGNGYEVFDLAVTSNRVFVAGGGQSPDGTAEAFSAGTGESVWHYYSNGDFQAVALLDDKLYFGGHFTQLFKDPWTQDPASRELLARRNKFMVVTESGNLLGEWKPKADKGIWAMTADPGDPNSTADGHIYAGGDFTQINKQTRRGFAQFSP